MISEIFVGLERKYLKMIFISRVGSARTPQMDKLYSLLLLTLMMRNGNTYNGERRDYCESHIFRANCPASEVVIIEEASYGRMGLGTCLLLDVGYMGCRSDVLAVMDNLCSGRSSCEIEVRDLIVETNPCPIGLRSYLQVKYTCLSVLNPSDNCCKFHGDRVRVEAIRGVLASSITKSTGCGSNQCPWVLTAHKGQKWNFTLYNFAVNTKNTSDDNGNVVTAIDDICTIYATIKDGTSSNIWTLCAGRKRTAYVYTSASHNVEVRIIVQQGTFHPFLLEYEAFGCADPTPPSYGLVERWGDEATIQCVFEHDFIWNITCLDGQWAGYIGNCTLPKPEISQVNQQPSIDIPGPVGPVLIIVMIIAVAIIISLTIMVAGITYLKKHTRNQRYMDRGRSASYARQEYCKDSSNSGSHSMTTKTLYIRKSNISSNIPWQYTRPLPEPGDYVTDPDGCKRPGNVIDNEVKYYVLDPEISNSARRNNEINVI